MDHNNFNIGIDIGIVCRCVHFNVPNEIKINWIVVQHRYIGPLLLVGLSFCRFHNVTNMYLMIVFFYRFDRLLKTLALFFAINFCCPSILCQCLWTVDELWSQLLHSIIFSFFVYLRLEILTNNWQLVCSYWLNISTRWMCQLC